MALYRIIFSYCKPKYNTIIIALVHFSNIIKAFDVYFHNTQPSKTSKERKGTRNIISIVFRFFGMKRVGVPFR